MPNEHTHRVPADQPAPVCPLCAAGLPARPAVLLHYTAPDMSGKSLLLSPEVYRTIMRTIDQSAQPQENANGQE